MSTIVTNGEVRLATAEIPGDGPSIVLMHGLSVGASRTMKKVAARLPGWRVVTMDLRGHGRSSTATWEFPQVVADLAAVIEHYELDSPYVGGHSLGGMVALQYALSGRAVSGAINIDGWGPGLAERYLGEDAAIVTARLDRYATGELPSRVGRVLAGRARQSREGTTRQVLRLLHGVDVVAWHREAPCRSLAVNATAPVSRVLRRLMGEDLARMQDAHRRGLRQDLAALAQQRADVSVVEVDATHGLISTHPGEVASAIRMFHHG